MFKKFREPMNGLTHFVGVIFALYVTGLMIFNSLLPYRPDYLISFGIYGLGMISLFTASTIYHWLNLSAEGIKKLRKIDHIMIFVSIAATDTPLCIISIKGILGWEIVAGLWFFTIIGALFKIFWITAPRWFSTIIYLVMSWTAFIIIFPLLHNLSMEALFWLAIGGVFFMAGAIIYGIKKPNPLPGFFGFHEIFHIFILLGSVCHFWFIYKYIGHFA
ncbi:MAG: hemolysin III family protein [Bacteroidota bacterium]|nr:hemolysin III family protein [Bacteroidota bacterium]